MVIASSPLLLAAVAKQGAYAYRADGRSGSVHRGSPVLHAEFLATYAVGYGSNVRRSPKELQLQNLYYVGATRRRCEACGATGYTREPIRRMSARMLGSRSGMAMLPREPWPGGLEAPKPHDGVQRWPRGLRRAPMMHRDRQPNTIAHTEGADYFIAPVTGVLDVGGVDGLGEAAASAWADWSTRLVAQWDEETREDDFGQPFLTLLPEEVTVAARRLAGQRLGAGTLHDCTCGMQPPGGPPAAPSRFARARAAVGRRLPGRRPAAATGSGPE